MQTGVYQGLVSRRQQTGSLDFGQAVAVATLILIGLPLTGAGIGAWLWAKHRILGALVGAVGAWAAAELVLYLWGRTMTGDSTQPNIVSTTIPPATINPGSPWSGQFNGYTYTIANTNGAYLVSIYMGASPFFQSVYPTINDANSGALAQISTLPPYNAGPGLSISI